MNLKTKTLVNISLLAAITAVLSQIALPIPFTPVPINLATLGVFLCGSILGAKYGALSQIVYVLLGLIGLPVFSGFSSGAGILMGPTGGYIIGYVFVALCTGLLTDKLPKKFSYYIVSMAIGLMVCYAFGTVWFMYLTKASLGKALTACIIPFIPRDIFKIIVASIVTARLRKSSFFVFQ
ncbi:MAG: biotin transporter BioY [Clostridium cadaveris]|uniref:Biotin transporter n=1 Tax=Clostridium cadaveris TaxID=1529 RepID=A0A316M5N6_9CLOT|nr:MAG: biotin transporter BioY [Clostridium cadaveris]